MTGRRVTDEDRPTGFIVDRVLSHSARGEVLAVTRAGERWILRIGPSVPARRALAQRVQHPTLPALVEHGTTPGGRPYLLRRWIDAVPFASTLDDDPELVTRRIAALLAGLAALHEHGYVHRDISSSNVLVEGERVWFADLDLAARGTAPAAGTPGLLAPELLLGQEATPSSDLFSVGAMVALGCGGAAQAGFTERFPALSFWEASGLDPRIVPERLRSLVTALVRRQPRDRPGSAAEALALLDVDSGVPPFRELGFLEGRESSFDHVVAALLRTGGVVSVAVENEAEVGPLLDALEVELAVRGRPTTRAGEPDRAGAAGSLLLAGPEARDVGVEQAFGAWQDPAGVGSVALVWPADVTRCFVSDTQGRLSSEERGRWQQLEWPAVSVEVLATHLERLGGDATPGMARRLAESLHDQCGGSWGFTNERLRAAVDERGLRLEGDRYMLLVESWPSGGTSSAPAPGALPSQQAAQVMAALSVHPRAVDRKIVEQVTSLDEYALAAAEADLRLRGAVRSDRADELVADGRWSATVGAELSAGDREAWHRRWQAVLDEPFERAWHAAHLCAGDDDPVAADILEAAEHERLSGRLSRARMLLDALGGTHGDPVARDSLRARLDLAQGHAERVLRELASRWGDELEIAPAPIRVAASLAAEQLGLRDRARRLSRSLVDGEDGPYRCWGWLGLAHAALLDGDLEECERWLGAAADAATPEEVAVALLNVQGAVSLRRGGFSRADEVLSAAVDRARRAGDPVSEARSLLNRARLDRRRGRLADAVGALERSVDLFGQAGHVGGRALALNNLGVLQRDRGDLLAARQRLGAATAVRRRVGAVHGAASGLANLALVSLDAGEVARALAELATARDLLAAGDYRREVVLIDLQQAAAMAMSGGGPEARARYDLARARPECSEFEVQAGRVEALVGWAEGRMEAARSAAASAARTALQGADEAERFRAAALLLALQPGNAEALSMLTEAAAALGDAPVRVAELAFRSATACPDSERLAEWLETFDGAGRTDLVWRTARLAAQRLREAGDISGRRRMTARANQAADVLTEGADEDKEIILKHVDRLAGGPTAASGLGVDWFLQFNRRMAGETDLDGVLKTIVDAALEITDARRGYLVLLDDKDIAVEVARDMDHEEIPSETVQFSRTVVHRALEAGEPLVISDAARDPRFLETRSIDSLQLRSVLCVPFTASDGVRGALYLDNEAQAGMFDEEDVAAVRSLADQAAIAITNQRRRETIGRLNERLSERLEYQEEELERTRELLRRQGAVAPVAGLVGESEPMLAVARLVERLAPTELPVLVTGPSGTGKDLVARALHERSRRADGPLIIENVAALPAQLLESELFGHVRGAFTGADRDRPGLFAEADGGTFVLDEIGEMPAELQAKLLRVIETGEVRPVGSRKTIKVDARVVAVTNRELAKRVGEGEFREDLYYRLNAAEIVLPSLEERLEDIPLLVRHFLDQLNRKHGSGKTVGDGVLTALLARSWPGNVRELSNEVARLYFLSGDEMDSASLVRSAASTGAEAPMPASLKLEEMERAAIERALSASGGRKDKAAALLGISRAGLYAKLRRLGLG